jgi:rubrerythrin
MGCNCEEIAKVLLDLRQSIREEEKAVDDYFARGQRAGEAGEPDLKAVYQEHVLPEEQEHRREFAEQLTKLMLKVIKDCDCPEIAKILW